MPITVDHIRDVSFKDHFLGLNGDAPVNGKITVNDNTFDVSFDNGKVKAKFASGNWFTNFFRGKTMGRFTEALQTQYNDWIKEKTKASAADAGFKDNPGVPDVKKAVDECFDILYANRAKLDATTVDCSKSVMKAFAMPHSEIELDENDVERLGYYLEGKAMPPNLAKYLDRLGQIAELAAIRNELTTAPSGTEAANTLLERLKILTHLDENCAGQPEAEKKRHVLRTIDNVIDGFLQAVRSMKNKDAELVEFLDKFDGVCLEAKSDNVQEWSLRQLGAGSAARSEEKHDLAYSAAAEFNVLADEVKAPFREAARKECEAAVRAECAEKGIVNEEEIERRISSKVEMILFSKEGEIAPLIRRKLETEGRFALYDNLAGAKRPVTAISRNGDKWTVTTVKDKSGNVLKKPVSAYDIDRNFSKLVDMYMEDAVALNAIENVTVEKSYYKVANRMDHRAKDVVDCAIGIGKDPASVKKFAEVVKSQLHFKIDIPAEEFEEAVGKALGDVTSMKDNSDDAKTEAAFGRFMNNYADGSYADQLTDTGRLANLVARRVEYLTANKQSQLANLDTKAAHCAQMLKMSYKDRTVDVRKAQEAIETTLRNMIERVQRNDPADQGVPSCKKYLGQLMYNGRLFTDMHSLDIAHRPAGKVEIALNQNLKTLLACVKHYGQIDPNTFLLKPGQEVKA